MVLIPKNSGSDFRPIAIASAFAKIFEGLIKTRLKHWCKRDLALSPTQYGFRYNQSCNDNIALIITDTYKSFVGKEYSPALLIDIKGAFDNVEPFLLIKNLVELRIPSEISTLIAKLTHNRRIYCYCNGHLIDSRIVYKGLPQGSILSPLLFILYIRKILHSLSRGIRSLQYADDIILYSCNTNLTLAINLLQTATNRLESWLSFIGLEIAPQKYDLIIFSRKKKNVSENANILIGNHTLHPRKEVKFLGILLDARMTWRPLINLLKIRARNGINILKSIFKLKWGFTPLLF